MQTNHSKVKCEAAKLDYHMISFTEFRMEEKDLFFDFKCPQKSQPRRNGREFSLCNFHGTTTI